MRRRTDPTCPVKHYVFERQTFVHQTIVDAQLVDRIKLQEVDGSSLRLLADEDAYARRHILRCFGKSARQRLECPATWWDHLKQALRQRWPRLFRRLVVQLRSVELDTGVVLADIPEPVQANHWVIPYVTDPNYLWSKE